MCPLLPGLSLVAAVVTWRCDGCPLQVTSSALALVTHQVGMHCRERGFLLAHIWNLHLGLQEFEMEQLKLHTQALRADKRNLEVMDGARLHGTVLIAGWFGLGV